MLFEEPRKGVQMNEQSGKNDRIAILGVELEWKLRRNAPSLIVITSESPLEFGASYGPSDRARYNLQPRLKLGSRSDFGAGFGPKGLGNLAQALASVASQ